jgi:hypothetical protein
MAIIENLPGIRAQLLDGNLGVTNPTLGPITLVLGTAIQGRSHYLTPVSRLMSAASYFGYEGTLTRGIIEAHDAGARNIYAYRIGGSAASVTGIGSCPTVAGKGLTIKTTDYDDEAGDQFYVTWIDSSQRLIIWDLDGNLVFDNNPSGVQVDTGDVYVYGNVTGVSGPSFGTTSQGILMSALDQDLSGGVECVEYTAGTDGINLTRRGLYEALQDAYRDLAMTRADIIVPMDIYLDDLNLADDATLVTSGLDYLGWFKEEEVNGDYVYSWSDATTKPSGYHEVNFAYQLANFCHTLTVNVHAAIGFVGCRPPGYIENYGGYDRSPAAVNRWIGEAPTYNEFTDQITANGTGLLGNKFMGGTTSRNPGFYATQDGYLDGIVEQDDNNEDIQVGKYISVVPTWHQFANAWSNIYAGGYAYLANDAPSHAGQWSRTPINQAPLFDQVSRSMREFFFIPQIKLDALVQPRAQDPRCFYAPMSFEDGYGVVCLDSPSAATADSDYRRMSTTRIAIDVLEGARTVLRPFIGKGTTEALRLSAEGEVNKMLGQKREAGIVQGGTASITATPDQQILGYEVCDITIVPAFELRQIDINIGLVREIGL